MKIRTRLLFFLLPILVGGIALITLFFAYSWYSANLFEEKLRQCLFLIGLSVGLIIPICVIGLYIIANKISRPVQKLNNSALAIAAGHYGESIQVDGPKEIAELANTLNTMSQCLHEQINRLKDNARLQEEMIGEYECAILLQHLMLQKNIDQCRSDAVAIQSITFFSSSPRGLMIHFPKVEEAGQFQIHMKEAEVDGLEGMYQLLTRAHQAADEELLLDTATGRLIYSGKRRPLIWSLSKECFLPSQSSEIEVETGDFFFLFNRGLLSFYRDPQKISALLSKVLKVFAQEGLKTCVSMLQKEIGFAIRRKELAEDIHLLSFQVLS
ncbi:MAG TPA: HAMP domain-containing protein [Chlamydiales bacterium]|nr:MAG: hypothetical protein A3F67_07720 [Verrucomicrobia bacterium RIFCSPHIGHO2_12_FULL_41_10]HLB52625.1 HAMP domain-containing protein [Chlamydiales bacterium]